MSLCAHPDPIFSDVDSHCRVIYCTCLTGVVVGIKDDIAAAGLVVVLHTVALIVAQEVCQIRRGDGYGLGARSRRGQGTTTVPASQTTT